MICDELIHAVLSTGTHSPSMRSNMHGHTGDLLWWMEAGRWIWNTVYIQRQLIIRGTIAAERESKERNKNDKN